MGAAGLAGLVLGYCLGLRFRVMILLPVELAALAAGMLATLCGTVSGVAAFGAFALFSVCVQASYAVALAAPMRLRRAAHAKA